MEAKTYDSKLHNITKGYLFDIFEDIALKHNVNQNEVVISKDNSAFYIRTKEYSGLSGRDEYELLEIIPL